MLANGSSQSTKLFRFVVPGPFQSDMLNHVDMFWPKNPSSAGMARTASTAGTPHCSGRTAKLHIPPACTWKYAEGTISNVARCDQLHALDSPPGAGGKKRAAEGMHYTWPKCAAGTLRNTKPAAPSGSPPSGREGWPCQVAVATVAPVRYMRPPSTPRQAGDGVEFRETGRTHPEGSGRSP